MSQGRNHLQKALEYSEEKLFAQALAHTDEALIAFAAENDVQGYSESYSIRFHTFKHLYQYSGNSLHAVSALHNAQLGVEIANQREDDKGKGVAYINLAKAYELLNETENAIEAYKQALKWLPLSGNHFRQSVIADTENHLDALLLQQGDNAAEVRILKNIDVIKNSPDTTIYERDVWISGAYLRLVRVFQTTDRTKALRYLNQAENVITHNPELVIRADQAEKLRAQLEAHA